MVDWKNTGFYFLYFRENYSPYYGRRVDSSRELLNTDTKDQYLLLFYFLYAPVVEWQTRWI